jgi:predicted ATP-dependent endonuclease of OLD family
MTSETIETTPITVFVGPNNSGKSKVLSEILFFCNEGQINTTDVILDKIELKPLSPTEIDERIGKITLTPYAGDALTPGNIIVGKHGERRQINTANLRTALERPNSETNLVSQWYLRFNTLMLDGNSRISLEAISKIGSEQDQDATEMHKA